MTRTFARILPAIFFVAALAPVGAFAQVSYDRIVKAESEPANWLTYGGTYK